MSATSPGDVWAVGSYDAGGAYKTLIEHWNGSRWTITPSKNPAGGTHTTNTLTAVVALSRSNAWAFGFYEEATTNFRTLIEHWNGSSWSVVPSPSTGTGDNFLFGAAAAPGGPVWAVGSDSVSFGRTLALRWNGRAWTTGTTASPGDGDRFLLGVAMPAARYGLAVGSDLSGNQTRALAERWTGTGWTLVPAASPAAGYNALQAVAAAGIKDAWAVGTRRATPGAAFRTLAEHWNGSAWTAAASPSPGSGDDMLFGVAKVPGGGYRAVGTAGDTTLTEFRC